MCYIIILFLALGGCSTSQSVQIGYRYSKVGAEESLPFPASLAITAPTNANADDSVSLEFSYGQHSSDSTNVQDVERIVIEVTAVYGTVEGGVVECINSICTPEPLHYDDVVLYSQEIDNFYTEDYRCTITSAGLFSWEVEFQKRFSLDINFQDIDFNSGYIHFTIYEYRLVEGEEIVNHIMRSVCFYKNEDTVQFGTSFRKLMG